MDLFFQEFSSRKRDEEEILIDETMDTAFSKVGQYTYFKFCHEAYCGINQICCDY